MNTLAHLLLNYMLSLLATKSIQKSLKLATLTSLIPDSPFSIGLVLYYTEIINKDTLKIFANIKYALHSITAILILSLILLLLNAPKKDIILFQLLYLTHLTCDIFINTSINNKGEGGPLIFFPLYNKHINLRIYPTISQYDLFFTVILTLATIILTTSIQNKVTI